MFDLPDADAKGATTDDPLHLEETAEVIEGILTGLYSARYTRSTFQDSGLATLSAAVRFHDKFDIAINQARADDALYRVLKKDPFGGFAIASQNNDLTLGRTAIQLMRFFSEGDRKFDFWTLMADVKPSWQLALVKILSPEYSIFYDYPAESLSDQSLSNRTVNFDSRCEMSMKQIAARFKPK
jgi:hypothetical protein